MTLEDGDEVFLLAHGLGGKQIVALKGATPSEGDEVLLLPEGDKYVAIKPEGLHESDKIVLVPIGNKEQYVTVGAAEIAVPCVNAVLNPCLSSSSNWTVSVYVGTVTFGVAGGAGGCGTYAHLTITSHPYGGFKVAQISQVLGAQPLGKFSFWYRFGKDSGSDYQLQSVPPTETYPEAANWTQIKRNGNGNIFFTLGGYTPNKAAWADITAVCLC